jgi:hypothetical protein
MVHLCLLALSQAFEKIVQYAKTVDPWVMKLNTVDASSACSHRGLFTANPKTSRR